MRKWIFGLLVLVNVIFFAVMHWGGALTADANNPPLQAALNADKIKLAEMSAASASAPVPASAVIAATSAVAAVAHPQVVVPPPPAPPVFKLSCMEWGEFSGADLLRAEKALAPIKLGNRLKQRTIEYPNGYWVYIAPLKNHLQVEQRIAQLKARGIADYFIIQEAGLWQNAISLGVFKTEEAAKKYLDKLHGQGVKSATLGERASKLKYTVLVMDHLEAAVSSQIATLHKDFPESELKLVSCN